MPNETKSIFVQSALSSFILVATIIFSTKPTFGFVWHHLSHCRNVRILSPTFLITPPRKKRLVGVVPSVSCSASNLPLGNGNSSNTTTNTTTTATNITSSTKNAINAYSKTNGIGINSEGILLERQLEDSVIQAKDNLERSEQRVAQYNREIDKIICNAVFQQNPKSYESLIEQLKKERDIAQEHFKESREFYLKLSQGSSASDVVASDVWFPTMLLTLKSKNFKQPIKYFEIGEFPPMDHVVSKYKRIYVRECFEVIFKELMTQAYSCLINEYSTSMVVTGNPGIGKSRLYLYTIVRLIQGENTGLPPFQLVINSQQVFYIYSFETKNFYEIDDAEVKHLTKKKNVLRLIDGDSSFLYGWSGISILFSSPGNRAINNYLKVDSAEYIMPVWNYNELTMYNEILDEQKKLRDTVLQDRYKIFGGIPRFIYEDPFKRNNRQLDQAIKSFSAIKVLKYVQSGESIRQNTYSHRILKMVPIRANYSSDFYVDFHSKFIAEKIVDEVQSETYNELSAFYLAHINDKSGPCSVLGGRIYEMLCHRNFAVKEPLKLQLRSLSSDENVTIKIPADLDIIRFRDVEDIKLKASNNNITYYRPVSESFAALDAFIIDTSSKTCYGLQMTLNKKHGIKTQAMIDFLKWLPKDYKFLYVFLTPPEIEKDFPLQKFLTKKETIYRKKVPATTQMQYVCAFNIF